MPKTMLTITSVESDILQYVLFDWYNRKMVYLKFAEVQLEFEGRHFGRWGTDCQDYLYNRGTVPECRRRQLKQ